MINIIRANNIDSEFFMSEGVNKRVVYQLIRSKTASIYEMGFESKTGNTTN